MTKPIDENMAPIAGETSTEDGIGEANETTQSPDELITAVSARGDVHCQMGVQLIADRACKSAASARSR